MSISTPQRPSPRRTDPAGRTSHESAQDPVEHMGWQVGGRVDAVTAALVGGTLTGARAGAVAWCAATGGVGVDDQFTVLGAGGALPFTLSGLVVARFTSAPAPAA